jgi:signal peptidase II
VLIPGVLDLSRHWNEGAVWGIGAGHELLLLVLTAAILPAVVALAWHDRTLPAPLWALGLVLGGAAGNLYDRVVFGAVRDFLDLGWWPVFNLADSAIVVGVLVYAGWSLVRAPGAHAAEGRPAATKHEETA